MEKKDKPQVPNFKKSTVYITQQDTLGYIWNDMGNKPSLVTIYEDFSFGAFWDLLEEKFNGINDSSIVETSEIIPNGSEYVYNTHSIIKLKDNFYTSFTSFSKIPEDSDYAYVSNINFYYETKDTDSEELTALLGDIISKCPMNTDELDNEANTKIIKLDNNNTLISEPLMIKAEKFKNISTNYKDGIKEDRKELIKILNKNKSILSVICGNRGTGKTSFIRTLIQKVPGDILYLPVNMIDTTLNNIDFRDFLMSNHNSTIIVEDAENYFDSIHQKSNIYVINLLQTLDSLISDNLNVNFILTMNVTKDRIDRNLLSNVSCKKVIDLNKEGKKSYI